MGNAHILLADAGRPQRSDEYEWEYVCDTTVGTLSPDELADALASSIFRPLQSGHAYSTEELSELRSILRMRGYPTHDAKRLQCESDKFAVLVGWWVQAEQHLSGKERISQVRKRLLAPSKKLLLELADADFAKEFLQPWGGFVGLDRAKIQHTLEALVTAASGHIATIKKHMGRGKAWDYRLKRLHVHLTACFCEYFDNTFEPSRMSGGGKEEPQAFQEAVELLARAVFPTKPKGSGFLGAIREHIDNWNQAKRDAVAGRPAELVAK